MHRILWHRFRYDRLPILLFVVVYVVMTFPLITKLGETLPFRHPDTYHAIWHNWWAWEAIQQGVNINHVPLYALCEIINQSVLKKSEYQSQI